VGTGYRLLFSPEGRGLNYTCADGREKNDMETTSRTLKQKGIEQMKEFLLIALYLWLVFGLFIVYKSVILAQYHIAFAYHGFALINALALGKVMLVAKHLHLGERFDHAPLIYPTLLKSALFTVVLACFKILEDAAVGLYHGKSFAESIADLGGGTSQAILTLTLLLFVMLIPFVGFGELQRVLGEGKLKQLFFCARSLQNQPTREAA
jgi:hypothetical protein